jgi:hypothetical protein
MSVFDNRLLPLSRRGVSTVVYACLRLSTLVYACLRLSTLVYAWFSRPPASWIPSIVAGRATSQQVVVAANCEDEA